MEKLLRILFVISVIAFVTTVTACADDEDDKTVKLPSIFKFTPEAKGVTIDTTKDVYKITINPSLLTYKYPWSFGFIPIFSTVNYASIFTVTFKDDTLQGFIIPTTADKAEDLKTTHVDNLDNVELVDRADHTPNSQNAEGLFLGAPNGITHSFLADTHPKKPIFGFSATEINAAWSTLAPRTAVAAVAAVAGGNPAIKAQKEYPGVENILTDTKVKVSCKTTITGTKAASFTVIAPAPTDDLPIAEGTKTVCKFSLVGKGFSHAATGDDLKLKPVYKAWATEVVKLAKDDATKNIQKMSFLGIVTGDATASAITKAAGITADAETLGKKGFTAATSAKLVKAYKTSFSSFQKVEIVIAPVK